MQEFFYFYEEEKMAECEKNLKIRKIYDTIFVYKPDNTAFSQTQQE